MGYKKGQHPFNLNNDGYVVYPESWGGGKGRNQFWNRVRLKEEQKVKNLLSYFNHETDLTSITAVGKALIDMGEQERLNEIALLQKKFGVDFEPKDEFDLIKNFNLFYMEETAYKNMISRLERAYIEYNNKISGMAPSLSSLFYSHLQTQMGKTLNNFVRQHKDQIINNDVDFLQDQWEEAIWECVDHTLRDVLFSGEGRGRIDDIYGSNLDYSKLATEYEKEGNKEFFHTFLRGALSFTKIENVLKEQLPNIQELIPRLDKLKGRALSGMARKAIGKNSQAGTVNGSVNQFINKLLADIGGTLENYEKKSYTFISQIMKTDNIEIFKLSSNVDFSSTVEELDKELLQSKNLLQSKEIVENFYNKHFKGASDDFIIFTSGKAYSAKTLEKSGSFGKKDVAPQDMGGFSNGASRNLEDLPTLLEQGITGLSIQRAQDFLTIAANTIDGAILSNGNTRNEIEVKIRRILTKQMAYLLFDDWTTLGRSEGDDAKAIHVFTLNDLKVPLSVLLIGAGQAIDDAASETEWFRVNLEYIKGIKYENRDKYEKDDEGHVLVEESWEKQREEAPKDIRFTTYFLKNFYTNIVNNLNIIR